MTFAQPWMLAGLAAALLPLLVHLLQRRRPKPLPFGAFELVLRSERRTASRLRLRRILLFLARTAILAALPLALAKPQRTSETLPAAGRGVAATAVVVDQSLVTRRSTGDRPLFESLRRSAREALLELRTEEPSSLVACGREPRLVSGLSFDRASALAALDELSPTAETANLDLCLEAAARALDESPLPGRRVIVVSPVTQASLGLDGSPPSARDAKGAELKPEYVLRPVPALDEALPNRAIVEGRAEPAPQNGPGAWQFTFTLQSFDAPAVSDLLLELRVDGAVVAKGFVDLPAGGRATKSLSWRFAAPGSFAVEGVLEHDALPDDDRRTFVVAVPRPVRTLLVNGSPSPNKIQNEAFFVEAALEGVGGAVQTVVREGEAAWREVLGTFDAIFLLNVTPPPPEASAGISAFVRKGGGLFLSVGENAEPDAWNRGLGDVLPRRLRVVKTAGDASGAERGAARGARLRELSSTHPIVAPFVGRAREGLLASRFRRYALLEPGDPDVARQSFEVLASLDDDAPVLVSSRVGSGRVVLLASTVDTDWCDLPIRSGFLPLVQRTALWLVGALEEREVRLPLVGERVALGPDDRLAAGASVSGPAGRRLPAERSPEGTSLTVGPIPEPGYYAVMDAKGGPLPEHAFAARLDPRASDTSRIPAERLVSWFGDEVVQQDAGARGPGRVPVWSWLLALGAIAFFLEGLLLKS